MKKRFCRLLFMTALFFLLSIPAYAAYGVNVGTNVIQFTQNGSVTGSYATNSQDVVLTTDAEGDLLTCFYNQTGSYVGVTLGDQSSVTISGRIGTLTLHSDLDRSVTIAANTTVDYLVSDASAPVTVTVYGQVGDFSQSSDAAITTAGSGKIGQSTGTFSNSSSSGSSRLTLRVRPIYSYEGVRLNSLKDDLEDCVTAYNSSGRRVSGTVEWTSNVNTRIYNDCTMKFRFIPNGSGYSTTSGSVRIRVDGDYYDYDDYYDYYYDDYYGSPYHDGDNIDLDIEPLEIDTQTKQLSAFTSQLNSHVTAYDNQNRIVEGRCRWINEDKSVTKTASFSFLFIPDDNRYEWQQGRIKIYVNEWADEDDDDDDVDSQLDLDIEDIDISSNNKRLSQLRSKLNSHVTAYNSDGDEVDGHCRWLDDDDQRVRESDSFEFVFIPDSSRYDEAEGEIWINVD